MDHDDHVELLRHGVPGDGGTWADLGSGRGAFTLALAELIGSAGHIYSVDKDAQALQHQEQVMRARFPEVRVTYQKGDFTQPLSLPYLDGIVMANALHFVRHGRAQASAVTQIRDYLRPAGRLLLVEYGTDRGNRWVPYPLSFSSWQELASRCGFSHTSLLARRPSRFLGEIYAAVSVP